MKISINFVILFLCLFTLKGYSQTPHNQQWPSFRGPWALGFIENAKTATTWNVETGEHIKWKTAIPGLGHSCPVIWDNFLFVTTAVNTTKSESLKVGLYGDIDEANDSAVHEFKVYCLDKKLRKNYLGKDCAQRNSEVETAYQSIAGQLHARY